jgi:DNA polymerase III epsilon subunit
MKVHLVPDLPIIEIPYVAIDIETTGLDARGGDRVIEVAALRFHRGNTLDSFVTFVNPQIPVKHGAYLVHGITDDMLSQAPSFGDIFDNLVRFIDGDVLVFHNAPFDLKFLKQESRFIGRRWVKNPVIDTLKLSRQLTGGGSGHSLHSLSKRLGTGKPNHRAMGDAHATGKILVELSCIERNDHLTLSELLSIAGAR